MNIIKWDTPNVFELTDHKFTAWRDTDNLGWTYKSIVGYKDLFDGFEFDKQKYFSSGLIIFNERHKEVFKSFKKLYSREKSRLASINILLERWAAILRLCYYT